MSFYNQGAGHAGPGAGASSSYNAAGGGGFYNTGTSAPGGGGGGGFGQQQSQTGYMQPGTGFANPSGAGGGGHQQQQQSAMMQSSSSTTTTGGPGPGPGGYMMQNQIQNPNQHQQFFNNAQAAATGLFAKGVTGNLTGDDVMQETQNLVRQVFKSGIPGIDGIMNTLRAYFAVDNRYVKRKMQKCLFPFISKQWRRFRVEGPPELDNFALPHTDENAPDLYLPIMSLITYCLLCALCYGTAGEFNPEVIADVTTKCFITQLLEVAIIRFGFYMMQTTIPILDLFAYTGYKYLGLTVNILFGMFFGYLDFGRSGYYVTFLWTASAAAYFMLKTMANNIPTETASTGPKREVMVLAFAASQAASMWFVSQTKYL